MKMNRNKMSHLDRGYSKEYETFFKYLLDSNKTIPNIRTKYIPQGICVVEDNILITAYDEERIDNSIIYLINNNGYQKKIILDGKYHGGGISYDKKNNQIYITGYGSDKGLSYVNIYNYNDILSYDDSLRSKLKLTKKIKVDESFDLISSASKNKISSPAYLYIHNNYLYVGNYHTNKSIIKRYVIDNSAIDEDNYEIINNPFFYTQGMCIYNLDNIDYYIFSSSKGRKNNSKLYIATLNNNILTKVGEINLPCMSEQVCIVGDKIIIIFESGARKYYNTAKNVVDSICYLDIEKIIIDICK